MVDLLGKKCVPCNMKELRPMTEEAANTLMPQVPEWSLVNEGGILKLQKTYKVKTFLKGLEFFQLVAGVAEAEGHHPDLHLSNWNNVQIDLWTHVVGTSGTSNYLSFDVSSMTPCKLTMVLLIIEEHKAICFESILIVTEWLRFVSTQGGLTENDFILAAKIGRLDAHHVLRRSVAK
ncbi:dehydratase [Lithospermum erythrorhizon]|uniref:4a-hydroxytetrahydrobiopterin dehydratase n=1 Tax=Lithospermum erythrorhizon TaxID=34254 RepID=A0AAV3QIH6_LITER